MSRGPSLNATQAPNVSPVEGLNTEVGGDRGESLTVAVSNVPRTRTQAQIPNGAVAIANGADGQERQMPVVSVIR